MFISYLSRLRTGFYLLLTQNLLTTFAFSFVFLFFKEKGYSLWWLILIYIIYSGIGVTAIPFVRRFYVRKYLLLSFIMYGLAAMLLWFYSAYSIFLYALLMGLLLIFFWLPLNYLFFKNSSNGTNAVDSSFFMAAPAVLAIAMPPLGALVINTLGYDWLFGLAAVLFLIPFFFIGKWLPEEKLEAERWKEIPAFKGLRTITFCEGALHFFAGVIIPAYALLFLKTPSEVGWFLSYLGAFSFIVAIVLSRRSDQTQKRKAYIFLLFFLLTISIVGLAAVRTAFSWLVAIGIFTVINAVSSPLRLAVSMDVKKIDIYFWKAREIFLNIGRLATLSFSAVMFYYQLYWPVFVLFGLITAIYPFLIQYKLKEVR